jgi:hypothetical protein
MRFKSGLNNYEQKQKSKFNVNAVESNGIENLKISGIGMELELKSMELEWNRN